jgi:hypothetical protein
MHDYRSRVVGILAFGRPSRSSLCKFLEKILPDSKFFFLAGDVTEGKDKNFGKRA